MRCHIIDSIEHRESWTRRYPELAARGEGTLVVIDPADRTDPAGLAGMKVTVMRPDASCVVLSIDLAEAPAGILGLFFRAVSPSEVPRGSTLELPGAS